MPRLTAITPGVGAAGFFDWLDLVIARGADAVQIREKTLDDRALVKLLREAVARAEGRARVLVSGRADVALAVGADGVHLPSHGLPIAAVRRLAGDGLLIGRSTHAVDEVRQAHEDGADYVYYSPVFETPGKAPPVGLAGLGRAVAVGVPVVALGGITIERLDTVFAAGAVGAAGIRMFTDPGSPGLRPRAYRVPNDLPDTVR